MSQPGPSSRLLARIANLPPDGAREFDAALERACLRARREGRAQVQVSLVFGPSGDIDEVELVARFVRRRGDVQVPLDGPAGGAVE